MPNGIVKLLEGGIDLVLSGGETFRGEKWQDTDNIAQKDELMKKSCWRIQVSEKTRKRHSSNRWRWDGRTYSWEEWQSDEGAPRRN